MLTITKATIDDIPDLVTIHVRSWEKGYTGIIPDEAIQEMAKKRPALWLSGLSGEHSFYIARQDGTPVGLMSAIPCRNPDLPDAGEIGGFYLHPDFWGKGCAQELMDYAISLLRARGHSVIVVWTLEKNARARRFYEKYGFVHDGASEEVTAGITLINIRYRISFNEQENQLER